MRKHCVRALRIQSIYDDNLTATSNTSNAVNEFFFLPLLLFSFSNRNKTTRIWVWWLQCTSNFIVAIAAMAMYNTHLAFISNEEYFKFLSIIIYIYICIYLCASLFNLYDFMSSLDSACFTRNIATLNRHKTAYITSVHFLHSFIAAPETCTEYAWNVYQLCWSHKHSSICSLALGPVDRSVARTTSHSPIRTNDILFAWCEK